MSLRYRQFLRDWKSSRRDVAESGLTCFGYSAPSYVLDAYLLWLAILYDTMNVEYQNDSLTQPWFHYSFKEFTATVLKPHDDIADVAADMQRVDEEILRRCEYRGEPGDLSFKHLGLETMTGKIVCLLLYGVLSASWKDPSCRFFRLLRTACLFLKRLNFVTREQKASLLQDWVNVQYDLDLITVPELDPRALDYTFGPFTLEGVDLVGKHGSGAVAEKCPTLYDKYIKSAWTPRLQYLAERWPNLRHDFGKVIDVERASRLSFVPKQLGRYRSICMEPAAMQYAEQGVKTYIYNRIAEVPHLSRHVRFDDSKRNLEAARQGSVDGSYATIDLEHASDSVSYELVKKWTRGYPLGSVLRWCRTPIVELPDKKGLFALRCFATMGAATTFPVETLTFVAICTHVILMQTGRLPVAGDFFVYGDDIAIRSRFAQPTTWVLETCGFKVNRTKSFIDTQGDYFFRESCGGHFCGGTDVTPLYIPRNFRGLNDNHPDAVSGLIELSNGLLDRYPLTRGVVLDCLLRPNVGGKSRRRVSFTDDKDDTSRILTKDASNYHLKSELPVVIKHWTEETRHLFVAECLSDDWQRPVLVEWRLGCEVPLKQKVQFNKRAKHRDKVALFEWLRGAQSRTTRDEFQRENPHKLLTPLVSRVGPKGSSKDDWGYF